MTVETGLRGFFPTLEPNIFKDTTVTQKFFMELENIFNKYCLDLIDIKLMPFRFTTQTAHIGKVDANITTKSVRLKGIIVSAFGSTTEELEKELEKFMMRYRLPFMVACWARSEFDKEWIEQPKKLLL